MLQRLDQTRQVERLLRTRPVVAVLGARQVGKTTLARQIAKRRKGPVRTFDLEDPRDVAELAEPTLALDGLRGLVVLDEVQRVPELFPVLRVLADRPRTPARFLVLGSASPELLRQSSETLAGRIAFHELDGFSLDEVGTDQLDRLWFRGGFPRSFLARSHRESHDWRYDFIRTFVERDLPSLGVDVDARTIERFWSMVAHRHGQLLNASELGRSLGVAHSTVRRYFDVLRGAFVVRELRPWAENLNKRVVRAPKIFIADSGIVHALLDIRTPRDLMRHPKLGASWEGFLIDAVRRRLGASWDECFFWATHAGAELDLLVVRGRKRLGFELKRTDRPGTTRSMRSARESLRLDQLFVIHAGRRSFDLGAGVRAVSAASIADELKPLPR